MKNLLSLWELRLLASCREFGVFLRYFCREATDFLTLTGACVLAALIADWFLSQLIFLIERL